MTEFEGVTLSEAKGLTKKNEILQSLHLINDEFVGAVALSVARSLFCSEIFHPRTSDSR
jgi:hypothetical protein